MISRERGLNPNGQHCQHQAAIFHLALTNNPSSLSLSEGLLIVIRCDGTSIPRVSVCLQFNLVSPTLFSCTALLVIVCQSAAGFWKKEHFCCLCVQKLRQIIKLYSFCCLLTCLYMPEWKMDCSGSDSASVVFQRSVQFRSNILVIMHMWMAVMLIFFHQVMWLHQISVGYLKYLCTCGTCVCWVKSLHAVGSNAI